MLILITIRLPPIVYQATTNFTVIKPIARQFARGICLCLLFVKTSRRLDFSSLGVSSSGNAKARRRFGTFSVRVDVSSFPFGLIWAPVPSGVGNGAVDRTIYQSPFRPLLRRWVLAVARVPVLTLRISAIAVRFHTPDSPPSPFPSRPPR